MARTRIAKKLNIVSLSTAPDELPQLGGVHSTLDRELNPVEPSSEVSSTGLNEVEQFNPVEPSGEKSSTGLNQVEQFNPVEPSGEKSSTGLNQVGEFNPVEPSGGKSSTGLNQVVENRQRKRRGARGKQIASGYLQPYTKNKKLKNGRIATFPRVDGKRDPDNVTHWYWGYRFQEKVDGEWKNRTLSVPEYRVTTVRFMINEGRSIAAIIGLIKGEFAKD